MHNEGMEVGAHSLTHPNLGQVDHDEAIRQVSESKRRLEEMLGSPIMLFAYPYGNASAFTPKVQELLRKLVIVQHVLQFREARLRY